MFLACQFSFSEKTKIQILIEKVFQRIFKTSHLSSSMSPKLAFASLLGIHLMGVKLTSQFGYDYLEIKCKKALEF